MLKSIRKNAKIFLYILIAALVAWLGFDTITSSRANPYAGKIFGKKIYTNEFQKSYAAVRTKAIFTYGDKFRDMLKDLNLEEEAWNRLILLYEAGKERIKTDDTEVRDLIKNIALFKDKNNKFDIRKYEDVLRYGFGLTPNEFEEQIRDDITIQKLIDKQSRQISVSDDELLREYKALNDKAKAEYILFKSGDCLDQIKSTEDEIKSFFDANRQKFNVLDRVNVEYFGKDFGESNDEEKSKITKEINDISYEFAGNKKFEDAAKEFSLQIKETGFFDRESKIPDIGFALNFADTALSLKPGQISEPIETKTGVYILRVKEIQPARAAEFDEAKDKAKKALSLEKAEKIAKDKAAQALLEIKSAVGKNEKFEDAAKELSLTIKETEDFSRNNYVQGIGDSPEFANAAFSLKEGQVFDQPVKVHDGYAVVKLASIIPADENKFNEEKEKLGQQLLGRKKYFNFLTWFVELRKRANPQSNIENLAPKTK